MNNNLNEIELETMEAMAARLSGTGGGAQAEAVIKAILLIKRAPGMLDAGNRTAALYHLAVALSGEAHAAETILFAAAQFDASS